MRLNEEVIKRLFQTVNTAEKAYLEQCESQIKEDYAKHFVRIFSTLNRKLSFETQEKLIQVEGNLASPLWIQNWSALRLARVWLLSLLQDEEKPYQEFINKLFAFADMQEFVALYSALPILDYPTLWIERCKEGIRSNIGLVQEAIIEQNEFPYRYLSEEEWNQLVLKAFFTGKEILNIYGLKERNNDSLRQSVVDYIYERHAAKRSIHPMLWVLALEQIPEKAKAILTVERGIATHAEDAFLLDLVLNQKQDEVWNILEKNKNTKECAQN